MVAAREEFELQSTSPILPAAATHQIAESLAGQDDAGDGAERIPILHRSITKSDGAGHVPLASNKVQAIQQLKSASVRSERISRNLDGGFKVKSPTSPRSAVASLHRHNIYRRRVQETATKLKQFFGDYPPVDVSVAELEREGLKAMLRSTVPMCYFLYALLKEHCSENLFFFLEVEQFESYNFATEEERCLTAAHLFDMYLTQNSILEVNIDENVRQNVVKALESKTPLNRIFESPKNAVLLLMEGSYFNFTSSPIWKQMVEDLGRGNIRTQRTQRKAFSLLRDYLHDRASATDPRIPSGDTVAYRLPRFLSNGGPDQFGDATIQRDRVIWSLVKEFCLHVAKLDVRDDRLLEGKRGRPMFRWHRRLLHFGLMGIHSSGFHRIRLFRLLQGNGAQGA